MRCCIQIGDVVSFGDEWCRTRGSRIGFDYIHLIVFNGKLDIDQPFYLLVDMQLGGSWVGKVDPADMPTHMIVDWIRVYQQ